MIKPKDTKFLQGLIDMGKAERKSCVICDRGFVRKKKGHRANTLFPKNRKTCSKECSKTLVRHRQFSGNQIELNRTKRS